MKKDLQIVHNELASSMFDYLYIPLCLSSHAACMPVFFSSLCSIAHVINCLHLVIVGGTE